MNFLDRNTLPKFQERMDLAASELNDMEEIICTAINELAGRLHIVTNLIPLEERSKYSQENSFLILDTIQNIQNALATLTQRVVDIENANKQDIDNLQNQITDLEKRLNALDDAAARKADLNVVLYRTGDIE
jgi:hypothetical protein